jgi:hypothetical protein
MNGAQDGRSPFGARQIGGLAFTNGSQSQRAPPRISRQSVSCSIVTRIWS